MTEQEKVNPIQSQHIIGSCLCGKVRFQISQIEPLVGHCHCIMCRKFHGSAFSTFIEVKLAHLTWLTGENNLRSYCADNNTTRKFCQHCGSSLLFESPFNRQANTVELALACIDSEVDVTPDAHMYLESKVNWFEPSDHLPQFTCYRK